ncbi:MAG: hypothetical protein ACE5G8_09165, partial [Anaerolineae bacterium]
MHHLLLVEDAALAGNSLYQTLADDTCTITLVHTPQKISAEMSARWPDLVILNMQGGNLNFAEVNRAITQTRLNIPRLAVAAGGGA